jgi:hypothetical protein
LPVCESIGRTWPPDISVPPKNQDFTMTDETSQESTPAPTEETTSHAPTPTTPWHKGMASPNPRGRPKQPKTVAEVRALAQEKTAAMIEVLGRVALNPKAPFAARVAAASQILDRGWGKPHQSMDINHGAKDGLAALLEEINGRFTIGRNLEGATLRPALEAQQSLLDHRQEREPDPVPNELGARKSDE